MSSKSADSPTHTPTSPTPHSHPPTFEVEALAREIHQLDAVELHTLDPVNTGEPSTLIAVLPSSKRIEDLTKIAEQRAGKPRRRIGIAALTTALSFIDHVNRFKGDASVIFVVDDEKAPALEAVYDYHPSGPDVTAASFSAHRARFAPQVSDEWKAWLAQDGKWMHQGDFAAFIEEHVTDLIVPYIDDPDQRLVKYAQLVQGEFASPSDLVGLSRNLAVNVSTSVRNAVTLSSGEISLVYDQAHKDGEGKPIQVPNLFTVSIPVFQFGDSYKMAARLRYRLQQEKVVWCFQLVNPELAFRDAIAGIVKQVADATSVPMFHGAAESSAAR